MFNDGIPLRLASHSLDYRTERLGVRAGTLGRAGLSPQLRRQAFPGSCPRSNRSSQLTDPLRFQPQRPPPVLQMGFHRLNRKTRMSRGFLIGVTLDFHFQATPLVGGKGSHFFPHFLNDQVQIGRFFRRPTADPSGWSSSSVPTSGRRFRHWSMQTFLAIRMSQPEKLPP